MPPSAWLCTRTAFVDSFCVRTHKDSDQAVSAQIRVGDVLLYHALRVEKRAVDGDGVLHHFEEPVPLAVVQRQDDARSEERRVGKEGRSRLTAESYIED